MYILGFILIFAGLSLFLYFFVQKFAGRVPAPAPEKTSPATPEADTISFPATGLPPADTKAPDAIPEIEPLAIGLETGELQSPGGKAEGVHPGSTDDGKRKEAPPLAEPDLFITGYLYVDSKRATGPYLDHPDRSPPESTAGMNRLGPSTLRSWKSSFQFDYGGGMVILPETRLKEIRFTPGGAVFVPSVNELPIFYFFTVETRAIREFLSQRSR